MDSQERSGKGKRRHKDRLKYFYLNGDLHRRVHTNRGADLLTAWNYPKHEKVGYSYHEVKRKARRAITTTDAAKILNRTRLTLEWAIINGEIEPPQMTYGTGEGKIGDPYKYMWREEDIMAMHAFLCTVHKGRPRLDGLITPYNLPSAQEIRARIKQEVVLYVKNDEGDFIPTWEAEHF